MKAFDWIAPSVLLSALLVLGTAGNAATAPSALPVSRVLEVQPGFYDFSHFTAARDALPVSRKRPVVSDNPNPAFTQTDPCVAPVSRSVKTCN